MKFFLYILDFTKIFRFAVIENILAGNVRIFVSFSNDISIKYFTFESFFGNCSNLQPL